MRFIGAASNKLVGVSAVLAGCLSTTPVFAANFLNGGFETGTFTNWTTSGEADIVGTVGTPAIAPPGGAFQAAASTPGAIPPFPPGATDTPVATLEAFFGVAAGSFQAIRSPNTTGTVISGAGFYQDVTVAAGDRLTFSWDFLTREAATETAANDYGFVVIGGTATRLIAANDSVLGALTGPVETINGGTFRSSGYRTFTSTFASGGTYRIGVGAISVNDEVFNSALLADNFLITPAATGMVPEPATWAMMIGGFGLVGGSLRRRRMRMTVSFA